MFAIYSFPYFFYKNKVKYREDQKIISFEYSLSRILVHLIKKKQERNVVVYKLIFLTTKYDEKKIVPNIIYEDKYLYYFFHILHWAFVQNAKTKNKKKLF